MNRFRFITIALLSATMLGLELIWTRIFSAEFFYAFAFLTLSLAIMGLGLGSLALRMLKFTNRDSLFPIWLMLTGLSALVGPPVIVRLGLDFSILFASAGMIVKFVLAAAILSSTYFFGGLALGMLFKRSYAEMPRLYMYDLVGAGLGVLFAVLLMNCLGTPAAGFVVTIPVLLAALINQNGSARAFSAILLIVAILGSVYATPLIEIDKPDRAPVIYKHWDAMAKIKMYDYGGEARGINIDNIANTPIIGFSGDMIELDTTETDWGLSIEYLIDRFDSCVFLSLGAGGGGDVLQALDHGATEIHAVEVISHINKMMTEGDPSGYIDPGPPPAPPQDSTSDSLATDTPEPPEYRPVYLDSLGNIVTCDLFSGGIYHDPRVHVVSEDARSYVRRYHNKFDLIYSFSSNSWAALGSGSFALAENYIFTKEAFMDYWSALSDSGYLAMEHQVYMPRLVSVVLEALAARGVSSPKDHIAVYNLPGMRRKLILISKQPLTDNVRQFAFGELTPERDSQIHLLYPPADSLASNPYNRIVNEGWQAVADSLPVDISPVTDDRPFVAQMGLWRNFEWSSLEKVSKYSDFMGFPLSKMIVCIILGLVVLILIPVNIIPYFGKGEKLKPVAWLYFFLIGTAFMIVEVVLIQKYTLFIGASVYSIITVLLGLLIASGVGSYFAQRISGKIVFAAIAVLLALEAFAFGPLTTSLTGLALSLRVCVSLILILPLGFMMGLPFPKGSMRVKELIDWGFSVNGAASVFGGTVVILIAISLGYQAALLIAAAVYLCALSLYQLRSKW